MTLRAIVDTGPLVAYLDRAEKHHVWAAAQIRKLAIPLLVCEPVLAEAHYLLSRLPEARDALFALLQNGALKIAFRPGEHVSELRTLLRKHGDRPMSYADACIVRMAEIHNGHAVFTLDADLAIYRKHGREPLALIAPQRE
ncbi:MAG: PIN domain-containing protein [Gammaproteobacteria bacterium]|nr:PIN domain-containing protein [Gammaproteobacteria bacterium]